MSDATTPSPPRLRLPAVAAVVIVGLVLAAAVIGLGSWLGGDPGSSAGVDRAQPIVAGAVVAPGQELTGGSGSGLPPLALITAEPVPAAIAALPPVQQAARYQAMGGNDPVLLVKLGAAYQRAGDPDAAEAAYRKALAADPGSLEARIGTAMVQGSRSADGLKAATAQLEVLTSEHPSSQVAWFNRGWIDAYAKDAAGSIAAWQKVVDLGPRTALGQTASGLLTRIARARKKAGGKG